MKTRARSASVFIHCFRVFGYPGETRARVVYMASQMNRDVTEAYHAGLSKERRTRAHSMFIRDEVQVLILIFI
jgi:superfamily II DNA helicase RecQ